MHASDLRTLIHYNYWARDRLFDALARVTVDGLTKPMGNSFSSIRDTLVHIYGAEWLWFRRFRGGAPGKFPRAEDFADLEAVRAAWSEVEANWRSLAANLEDEHLDTLLHFRTLKGEAMSSRLDHMIQHVVNHGTYHRGQVVTMLRQQGAHPPQALDLIYYYREQAGG